MGVSFVLERFSEGATALDGTEVSWDFAFM
jgi:hypothetical protein